jgi:hypothetical protein
MERRGVRRSRSEEEEESYFVSMADMMVGLLFIFIILLLYFALQFRQTTDTLTSAGQTRREILETLKERLDKRLKPYNLTVRIDAETGVLSLPNSILFDTGQFALKPEGRQAVDIVADELAAVLLAMLIDCRADRHVGASRSRRTRSMQSSSRAIPTATRFRAAACFATIWTCRHCARPTRFASSPMRIPSSSSWSTGQGISQCRSWASRAMASAVPSLTRRERPTR